jgi:hypothetical protein
MTEIKKRTLKQKMFVWLCFIVGAAIMLWQLWQFISGDIDFSETSTWAASGFSVLLMSAPRKIQELFTAFIDKYLSNKANASQ